MRSNILIILGAALIFMGAARPLKLGLNPDLRATGERPGVPQSVVVEHQADNEVLIEWDPAEGATGYRIYRGFGGEYTLIGTDDESPFLDTTCVTGVPNYYRITAVNAKGIESDRSVPESVWPVVVKSYRTPFYYLGQWRDYPDTEPLSQAEIDSMAQFDAIGIMPHFYEGAHERGYENLITRVREAADSIDGHEVVFLTYFFGNAARFNWAPGPIGLTHPNPDIGYQNPYPAQYDRSINPHTKIWDWCVANDAFLHDINGQPMVNLAFPVYNYDYGNLELADKVAEFTVEAYAGGPTDGEYTGFLYDFVNTDVQSWTADLSNVDIDRDGNAYNSSTAEKNEEIALYRAWHIRCLTAIRREFGERGMSNRLIVVNGNGAQNISGIAALVDGFMEERWNDGTNGWPGWTQARFPTSASCVAAWNSVLTSYCSPARFPKSQVRPYPFMFHMYVDDSAPWCSLAPALAVNGWAHGNNPSLIEECLDDPEHSTTSCYTNGANGSSRMSIAPTRLDPGVVGTYSIISSSNYPTDGDTLVVPAANYTMRMELRPSTPSIKSPWAYIITDGTDTLARGGGWPRQVHYDAPVAAFSGSPTSGAFPLDVDFYDESTGTPTAWSWTFGDGGTSTEQNPSHTYTTNGARNVSLQVTNPAGSDTETKNSYVLVTTPPAPVANFTASPLSGVAPLTVNFTDTSINTPTSWAWLFDTLGSSTVQNPSFTFTSAGTYYVILTATNAYGNDVEYKAAYITVSAPPPAPVAAFTGTPLTGTVPLFVEFTDQSTNTPTSWLWDFGDGTTATFQNPVHLYDTAGTYTVELTATNAGGSDDEVKTGYVTVSSGSGSGVTISGVTGYLDVDHGETVTISGTNFGTNVVSNIYWDNVESGSFAGFWTDSNGSPDGKIVASASGSGRRHANSSFHATADFSSGGGYGSLEYGGTSHTWFCQYWVKLDNNWNWGGTGGTPLSNVKIFRMYQTTGNEDFVVALNTFNGSFIVVNENITGSPSFWSEWGGYASEFTENVWHCWQFEYRNSSSMGAADGVFRWWRNGVLEFEKTDMVTMEDYSSARYPLVMGFYDSSGAGGYDGANTVYFDDFYMSKSVARVEIGNASTYAGCNHREIQIPTTWTASSITITANTGSFANGPAYLYVIDALGNVNEFGYQVSIGN